MKNIAVVTGTRTEYGYLKPLMKAIDKDSNLNLIPIITGMHLMQEFGNTYKIVKKDFSNSVIIPMKLEGDTLKDMGNYLADGVKQFVKFFSTNIIDIIIVLGDRSESFAAAIAAMYLNLPIAHINGGDVTGGLIDESIRHSITKISHLHFVHTTENAKRVERMGEEKKRIFTVGALTVDTIKSTRLLSKKEMIQKYCLDLDKKTFLVVQHPITTEEDMGYSQMKNLLDALDELKVQTIMLYPNCDAGSKNMINLMKKYEKKQYINIFRNLPHEDYLSIMKYSDIMIGNSSSGIIESPSFKIPVINIGERQKGRSRSQNIIDVKPEKAEIIKAINFVLTNKNFREKIKKCRNKFGDGAASEKMVKILKTLKIDRNLIKKQIAY